jgi:ankyrin repeat protein
MLDIVEETKEIIGTNLLDLPESLIIQIMTNVDPKSINKTFKDIFQRNEDLYFDLLISKFKSLNQALIAACRMKKYKIIEHIVKKINSNNDKMIDGDIIIVLENAVFHSDDKTIEILAKIEKSKYKLVEKNLHDLYVNVLNEDIDVGEDKGKGYEGYMNSFHDREHNVRYLSRLSKGKLSIQSLIILKKVFELFHEPILFMKKMNIFEIFMRISWSRDATKADDGPLKLQGISFILKELINKWVNNEKTESKCLLLGNTPQLSLIYASAIGSIDVVKYIYTQTTLINETIPYDISVAYNCNLIREVLQSALEQAVSSNSIDIVRFFLKKGSLATGGLWFPVNDNYYSRPITFTTQEPLVRATGYKLKNNKIGNNKIIEILLVAMGSKFTLKYIMYNYGSRFDTLRRNILSESQFYK